MFLIVDFAEEPPGTNPISPRLRFVALQLADMRTEVRVLPQPWIHGSAQLANDLFMTGPSDRTQILSKLLGLEDPVFMQ